MPLGALPHVPPSDYPYTNVADPTEDRPPLPEPGSRVSSHPHAHDPATARDYTQHVAHIAAAEGQRQARIEQEITRDAVRTALAVEPRDGRLCVFMPPVERVEDYLDLLEAAEDAARALGLPIHVEGYAPPHDPGSTSSGRPRPRRDRGQRPPRA
jgi:uncharacterized protein (DUF2126 family)